MEKQKIRKLPEEVITKICAGEVINSPINLIKECVENSLDANATEIKVITEKGGKDLIRIEDNGYGIEKSDLECACDRFTTSKLEKLTDLMALGTYGFRGEALFSISQISQLTLISRSMNSDKTYRYNERESPKLSQTNRNIGTTLIAKNIFYNFPLRQSSIKPDKLTKEINELMLKFALNYPHKDFLFISESPNNHFSSKGITNRLSLLEANIDPKIKKFLLNFEITTNAVEYCNVICSTPYYAARRKFTFILFINGRLVDFPPLRRVLKDVYSDISSNKCTPFIYLNVKIRTTRIDANVHPSKATVELQDSADVIKGIKESFILRLKKSLESKPLYTKSIKEFTTSNTSIAGNINNSKFEFADNDNTDLIAIPNTSSFISDSYMGTSLNNSINDVYRVRKTPSTLRNYMHGTRTKLENIQERKTDVLKQSLITKPVYKTGLDSIFQKIEIIGFFDVDTIIVQVETELISLDIVQVMKDIFTQWFKSRNSIYLNDNYLILEKPMDIETSLMAFLDSEESGYIEGVDEPKVEIVRILSDMIESYKHILNEIGIIIENNKCTKWPNEFVKLMNKKKLHKALFDIAIVLTDEGINEYMKLNVIAKLVEFYMSGYIDLYQESENKARGFIEGVVLPIFKGQIKEFKYKPDAKFLDNGILNRLTNVKQLFKEFERS